MELSSNQTSSATASAMLARQFASPDVNALTPESFMTQLAGPHNPPRHQATGLTDNSSPNSGPQPAGASSTSEAQKGSPELRQAFQDFVGQTFFAEMIKACRSSQQPSAYFNGGRAEEIFQGQLDQVLSEEISKSSADKIADPMFELFMLKRQS